MAGVRQAGQRERMERVTVAAWELFRTRGFEATSVREIAAAARVSVGTVAAVGDKSALFLATMSDTAFEAIGGGLDQLVRQPVTARRSLVAEVGRLFDEALAWVAANRQLTNDYLVAYLRAAPAARPPARLDVIVARIAERCVQHSGDPADAPAAALAGSIVYGVFISLILGLAAGEGDPSSYPTAMREVIAAQLRPFERRKP
jgi:AcrR family transcriptional regulator